MKKFLLALLVLLILFSTTGCITYSNLYTDYTLITDNAKTKYLYTEELNLDNVYLLGADTSVVQITHSMVKEFDNTKLGYQNVVIIYNEVEFSYEIQILLFYLQSK